MLIGGLELENPVILAPMAGVTLGAVRRLSRRLGAAATHTEMVSSTGLLHGGAKTKNYLRCTAEEEPVILQLFAGDVDSLARSAEVALKERSFAALSINMACPMPKVLKRGSGAHLLEEPDTAVAMVKALMPFGLPVWPKIRKIAADGKRYRLDTKNFAGALIEAGASLVALHGRTAAQRYEGQADQQEVHRLSAAFPGFIGASGDVNCVETGLAYMKGSAAAVFMARGAVSDPFLTPQLLVALGYNKRDCDWTAAQRAEEMIRFADEAQELHGTAIALVMTKRFLGGFFKGMQGITELRRSVAALRDWEEMKTTLQQWLVLCERGRTDV